MGCLNQRHVTQQPNANIFLLGKGEKYNGMLTARENFNEKSLTVLEN